MAGLIRTMRSTPRSNLESMAMRCSLLLRLKPILAQLGQLTVQSTRRLRLTITHRHRKFIHDAISSYHAYPDGTVNFSNPRLPRLQVTSAGVRVIPICKDGPDASSSATASNPPSAGQLPQQSTQAASTCMPPQWIYDSASKTCKFWDGAKWVS